MRILLVDDEHELVSTMAERLSFRGVQADWTGSVKESLKLVQENCYDLIVLDMKMPRMSGLNLKQMIDEKCPNMKYIFITGHGSEKDFKAACSEEGVVNYLIKPVDLDALLEKIHEALFSKGEA